MEDIIDYLRQQRMEQPPLPTPLSHSVRPKQRRTTYESIKLRLHLGLPGSIALMTAVGCMAPLYWDNAGYMTCYCIVLLITLLRVLIALQMNLAFQHVNPSRGVDEVAKYINRLELIHKWDRRYTLYVKVPLTVCVVALIWPPLGINPFAVVWVRNIWIVLTASVVILNFTIAYLSFRKLEKDIRNLKTEYNETPEKDS